MTLHRNTISYLFPDSELRSIKNKVLNWLKQFSTFTYADNNLFHHKPNRYELLVGAGVLSQCGIFSIHKFEGHDWLFGHLNYDLKNDIEPQLMSCRNRKFDFADGYFYQPSVVVYIPFDKSEIFIETIDLSAEAVLKEILQEKKQIVTNIPQSKIYWSSLFNKDEYKDTVSKIREHIKEGDCYELNLCIESFAYDVHIDPFYTFFLLNEFNPAPFAVLYRNGSDYLISASPERFLYKEDQCLISQPIKGTIRKSNDANENNQLKEQLKNDEKERAENVMITDLVRNDLAKSCIVGSIKVSELFGVYSFKYVNHLISTIEGEIKPDCSITDAILNAFPMGSMTGAPKIMVMELIEKYERSRREIYSGSIGYITPEGNFDFNVVIRSLVYNEKKKFISFHSGGAITYDSKPENEWEEIKLKSKAIESIFKG